VTRSLESNTLGTELRQRSREILEEDHGISFRLIVIPKTGALVLPRQLSSHDYRDKACP
jgi:hypothetical protein